MGRIVEVVKDREAAGWSYEAADASFELLIRDELAAADANAAGVAPAPRPFTLESYRVIVENNGGSVNSEATVKVHVGGRRIIATAEGNGPVNALDSALRSAVAEQYPELNEVELIDYKVRILAGHAGTDSITRVLVTSAAVGAPGPEEWTDGRRARQRRRGVLAGARRRAGLRAAHDRDPLTAANPPHRTEPNPRRPEPRRPEEPMRLARIAHPDGVAFAAIDGPDGGEQRAREIADHPFGPRSSHGKSWPLADVRLLAPILPSKVLCLGRNFRDHAAELGNPVPTSPILFMKPPPA